MIAVSQLDLCAEPGDHIIVETHPHPRFPGRQEAITLRLSWLKLYLYYAPIPHYSPHGEQLRELRLSGLSSHHAR